MDHTISDGGITAVIRAQGAELRSLRDPQGPEYIWQAGPAWPRCAPVLFLIVGRLMDDRLRHGGQTYRLTQHGFARDRTFDWLDRRADACRLVLVDVAETRAMYPFAFRTIKSMECAHVEMIEVRVGKKHDVDLGEVTNGQCGRGQAFRPECKPRQPDSDPRKQNRIRENLYPEKIDQHGCVPQPCRGYLVIAPLRRIWPSKSRSNWTPAFANPFVPQITEQTAST